MAARYHALSADHLEYMTEDDVKAMAESGTVAVLLPGAFYLLRETQYPPIESLIKHGVRIALSSDLNPGTSPALSLRLMLNMGSTLFRLTPEQALAGVTIHAAQALGLEQTHGSLEQGKVADFVAWDIEHPSEIVYWLGGDLPKRVVQHGQEVIFKRCHMNHTFKWQGRHDGEGEAHQRIHHIVNTTQHAEFALIGFSSDEGVKRNKGRVGAADAPDAIRTQLANLPIHRPVSIVDLGTVTCEYGNLEQAQSELAEQVANSLQNGLKPIVLGGGHEVAFGSFSGLFQYVQAHAPDKKSALLISMPILIYVKQSMPPLEHLFTGSSSFRTASKQFNYLCIGVANHANTKILFDTADALNCSYLRDHEVNIFNLNNVLAAVDAFIEKVDYLYVTIDLDVFTAAVAPGVSAPAVKGIDLVTFEAILSIFKRLAKSNF